MDSAAPKSLGLRHALLVFAAPRAVFARVEDSGAYGWAMVLLLGLVTLAGVAKVQTGLIDRDVDFNTETKLAQLERNRGHCGYTS